MKKIFLCILLSVMGLMVTGCVTLPVAPPEAMGQDVFLIRAQASSSKILFESVKKAKDRCAQDNKQYLFVKNIFQLGSYDLYFSCVEEDDPRLNQRKIPSVPAKEKPAQAEKYPGEQGESVSGHEQVKPGLGTGPETRTEPEKIREKKEKPPTQEKASPVRESVEEKPLASPVKEAEPESKKLTPTKENKQTQEDGAAGVTEEQLRKKNPGPGELENLRKDGSSLIDEDEQEESIIEEALPGDSQALENYLKKRRLKKK